MINQLQFMNGEYRNKALKFAIQAHSEQTRKHYNIPYICHVGRVVSYVEACLQSDLTLLESALISSNATSYAYQEYEEIIAAAVLHDALEDVPGLTDTKLILEGFTQNTVDYVVALTNVDKSFGNREKRKQADNLRLDKACKYVKIIKLADRFDNINDLIVARARQTITDGYYFKYLRETKELLKHIKVDCCLYDELSKLVRSQLNDKD